MDIQKDEASASKIKLNDLFMQNNADNAEYQDLNKRNTEKFLDELSNNRDSKLIQEFRILHKQGINIQKEEIFSLTEKIFQLLQFDFIHKDTNSNMIIVKNQDMTFTFFQDFRSDIIQLQGFQHRVQKSQQIDINLQINKDILSNFIHIVNSDIPFLTIDYMSKVNQIQCVTNTIGQLYDNYFNWLFYNIDSLTIACFDAVSGFQQIRWNASIILPSQKESIIISEKIKEKIKQKIQKNKQNYYQLLFNIEREFENKA